MTFLVIGMTDLADPSCTLGRPGQSSAQGKLCTPIASIPHVQENPLEKQNILLGISKNYSMPKHPLKHGLRSNCSGPAD